jgi:hypothetical protein
MRFASRTSLVLALLSIAAISGLGQDNPTPQITVGAQPGNCSIDGRAIAGRPYSALETTEVSQTLADGTRIEHKRQTRQIYRDSQGRLREENYYLQGTTGAEENRLLGITITDVVECARYFLNVHDHTATRTRFPNIPMRQSPPAAPNAATLVQQRPATPPPELLPKTTSEPLGTQTIEGIVAEGSRLTTTFPPGFVDNDRQIVSVSEVWTAPDLHIVLLRTIDDPRNGLRTTRLTNIDRSEPDAALFRVPPDYTITSRE